MKKFNALTLLLGLIFLCGCATITPKLPQKQITLSDAEKIISSLEEQGDMISSFYTLGAISIKGWILDSDADILIAGVKEPFSMKMEITHSWGIPILYVLIRENRIEVFSFQEKTLYTGQFTPEVLSRFLPGFNLDKEMIWSIFCGRPPIAAHNKIGLSGVAGISLIDSNENEVEIIHLSAKENFPDRAAFPGPSAEVFFSGLKKAGEIPYAGQIKLQGGGLEKDLGLKIKNISINASIPEQIFTMDKPSSYDRVNLDELP
jgi:hypothetical protein